MAVAKPNLTVQEFTDQFTEISTAYPFLSDEQMWTAIYNCWKYNESVKASQGVRLDVNDLKTVPQYLEMVVVDKLKADYPTLVTDKQNWIAELSSSPDFTALFLQQASLPENAGKSISEIASGMPFLFNL